MSDDYKNHYIQNDAVTPLPITGPRVTVGFWADETVADGVKPDFPEEPMFTITYPIIEGDAVYNWQHSTGDPLDPLHPNSAQEIRWQDGRLSILQSTEFGARPNLGRVTSATEKHMYWEIFRDYPPYLWGRIMATHELTDIVIREGTKLTLQAADAHFLRIVPDSKGVLSCDMRIPDEQCEFTARFPHYLWDDEGGKGDREGPFYLVANNGCYLVLRKASDGGYALVADGEHPSQAAHFSALMAPGCMISLAVDGGDGQTLTLEHEPPFGALHLVEKGDPVWGWFIARYI